MIDRHRARTLTLQALCQLDAQGEDFLADLDAFLNDEHPPADVVAYARNLVRQAWSRREEIDAHIRSAAENWELRRMAAVDRNVLRAAVAELLTSPDLPTNIVVNEAIEIGKEFGSRESGGFINGVLDGIVRALRPARRGPADTEQPSAPLAS